MKILEEIGKYVKGIFDEVVEFLTDLPLTIFESFLSGINALIASIPVPDFMQSDITSYFPPDVAWFLAQSAFPQALTIVGSGIVFYIIRRIVTLGIW